MGSGMTVGYHSMRHSCCLGYDYKSYMGYGAWLLRCNDCGMTVGEMTVLGSSLRRGRVSYVSVVCRVRPCVTVAHTRTGGGRDVARAVIQ